jgi:hypothetical protein
MIYQCCDSSRRAVLANQSVYNGIDYLEVADGPLGQETVLYLYFLHPLTPGQLEVNNISICGGERIRNIQVASVVDGSTLSPPPVEMDCTVGSPPDGSNLLVITVLQPGDFSTYTLSLVANTAAASSAMQPPPYFDPVYSQIKFSFKVSCPAWFDCQQPSVCPPASTTLPNFSYLAKDYASFRSLMLDRMSTILPAWSERNPADLGIVLVELLAYVGDYLSYQQDAVATEAYLGTARRRTSVRRHVKLVDYPMLDGRNARTWIHFDVTADFVLASRTWSNGPQQLLTQGSFPGPIIAVPESYTSDVYNQALTENPQVFELMEDANLFAAHSRMNLYTWGDQQCCLPAGATHAWLIRAYPNLAVGTVVIFMEVKGPETGAAEDADPTHRWAVRLTAVEQSEDPIGNLFATPPSTAPLPVTRIEWSSADALPFAVCVSGLVQGTSPTYYDGISVVLGNNALADCGRTILDETLPEVPAVNPALVLTTSGGCERCSAATQSPEVIRYNPQLASGPLTFADPYSAVDTTGAPSPAMNALNSRVLDGILPSITLTIPPSPDIWEPQIDLLHSHSDSKEFVAETEDDGTASLRFGDGTFGVQVIPGEVFHARYRVGGGTSGNVGPDSLCRIASDDAVLAGSVITAITNPLPATGGLDPETLDSVRNNAPYAFNTQERAVTSDDYGAMALVVDPTLQQARGTFRWTGSWNTVFIAVDPEGAEVVDQTQKDQIISGMELYRMAGHDVDVDAPVYVSLEVVMNVCAKPGYLAADVQQALLQLLSNHVLPDGSLGLFSPDNFSFGQPVYLSPIIAAVQQADGVSSVTVTTFQRQGQPATSGLDAGVIPLQSLEIARLDNDPNFPEHGILTITVSGGN